MEAVDVTTPNSSNSETQRNPNSRTRSRRRSFTPKLNDPTTGQDGERAPSKRSNRSSGRNAKNTTQLDPPASHPGASTDRDVIRPAPVKRNPRRGHPPTPQNPTDTLRPSTSTIEETNEGVKNTPTHPVGSSRRGAKFNGGLTESSSTPQVASHNRPAHRYKNKISTVEAPANDLTSTLIHALRTPPYPDCPICFSSIHPGQRTWSCSPSIPVIGREGDEQQYCWTTFHVKCIGEWAAKSVKEVANAWRARGEEGRKGDWRCPGCQAKRETVPSGYWCFCNSTTEPKLSRLATPHSCGNLCSRVRESGCGHPCPLACHPGPCPPCQITTRLECYCPRKKIIAFRCGLDQGRGVKGGGRDLSCGSICGRTLGCGKHSCERVCHEGACEDCSIIDVARCWCGSTEKEIRCGEGQEIACLDSGGRSWAGRFGCDHSCQILFDCGFHKCEQPCHPPHQPTICPLSPSIVTHCPCGKYPIAPLSISPTPNVDPTTFPARQRCTSPIPTCTSPCNKTQPNCEHLCVAPCHTGSCPPCAVSLVRPCRCGATTRNIRCFELRSNGESISEILCDKPCMALRSCGRHQCRRQCCPLAALASGAGKKGKRRAGGTVMSEEENGLHECDLVCGKMLSCGNHTCEERDHKGPCPPCLRSSFEEMVCYCGRTVLDPPIPCGTQIQCHYQCPRPPPPCGHPGAEHACHEDPSPCPPCPFLTTKKCACGKKMIGNVRCSLENDKVSCGTICGKLMACGFHHCERLCHSDDCGTCVAPCGKSRKHCLPEHHPCTRACHAPSTCSEDEPCHSLVSLTCSCGRIRQAVHCGRSTSNTAGQQHPAPKCNNECTIAKRNARLADALGISAESREKAAIVSYHDELVAFARVNIKFLGVVEKAFEEFVSSQKKTQVLPPMPPDRRKFVHGLAGIYRMDTQMVDQEPRRSVQLLRRLDTRIPTPLLSNFLATTPAPSTLGKLTDLRSSTAPSWRASTPPARPSASGLPQHSGWASPRPIIAPTATKLPANTGPRPTSITGASRTSTPAPPPVADTTVPDNWEDDV